MENNPNISVVSPVYQAEKIISELVKQLHENLTAITDNYEIILVNDGSSDSSWPSIFSECEKDKRVKGINLSRNFGQHYAITAGLTYTKGEWVIVMDCDLQDRPDEIPNLYNRALEGWDIVYARRSNRQDNFFKKMSSKIFNIFLTFFTGINLNNTVNFGIYHSNVISEYNKMKEYSRAFCVLIRHLGFLSCTIDVNHSKRYNGKSSYNLTKLFKLAFDIIISNTNKPLKLTVGFGFAVSLLSFLLALYNLVAKFIGIIEVPGYTSTIFSIWFVGGLILFVLGMIGLYIGKIFDQVKDRPLFIVRETINF